MSRRLFLKRTLQLSVGAGLAGIGGAGYAVGIEPGWVDVRNIAVMLPRLSSVFHGYRVVQVSDLHAGGWTTREHLADVVATVNAQSPDLIVITGDFVSGNLDEAGRDIAATLGDLSARDGVLAVLGNHDHWAGVGRVREILAPMPLRELANQAHTIERGGSLLTIAGVDDIWEKMNRLEDALAEIPTEGAAILLAHEPDFADEAAASGRFDLQLSGHSHGGQVVIPFLAPPQLPYLGRKYHTGLYKVGEMLEYTNRGIGMIRPYVRFNCRPEITVLELRSQRT